MHQLGINVPQILSDIPESHSVNIELLYWEECNIGVEKLLTSDAVKSEDELDANSVNVCVTNHKYKTKARTFVQSHSSSCLLLLIGDVDKVETQFLHGYFESQSTAKNFCRAAGRLLERYVLSFLKVYTEVLNRVLEVQERMRDQIEREAQEDVWKQLAKHGIYGKGMNCCGTEK